MSAKIIFLTTEARRGRAPDVPVSLGLMDTFLSAAVGAGLYSNVRNLRRYLAWLFAGVDLRGKRFLDVGAGQGLYSLYAAAQGACAVVALEPQAAGSRQGANARMQNLAQEWGLSLRHLPEDLEAHAADHGDDVILLHNVINHLDEPATVDLLTAEPARQRYRALGGALYGLTAPGGRVVIADSARRNLFGDLRLKNPISPTIEWAKHQQPRTWSGLAAPLSFEELERLRRRPLLDVVRAGHPRPRLLLRLAQERDPRPHLGGN